MNKIALELIDLMEKYIDESSKKDYIFSLDEQINLQNMINILNKQIDILIDYELKRNKD